MNHENDLKKKKVKKPKLLGLLSPQGLNLALNFTRLMNSMNYVISFYDKVFEHSQRAFLGFQSLMLFRWTISILCLNPNGVVIHHILTLLNPVY